MSNLNKNVISNGLIHNELLGFYEQVIGRPNTNFFNKYHLSPSNVR